MAEFKVDFPRILDALGDDAELLHDTIEMSLRYIPLHVAEIEKALAAGSPRDLEATSHKLKGSVSIYYCEPATRLSFELEKMGRENNLAEAEATFRELESVIQNLFRELKDYQAKNPFL